MKPSTVVLCLLLATACTSKPTLVMDTKNVPSGEPGTVLVGAGDIASCDDLAGAQATAKLLENIPGTVFAAGDLAYPDGSDEQFEKCYGATSEVNVPQSAAAEWGQHRSSGCGKT